MTKDLELSHELSLFSAETLATTRAASTIRNVSAMRRLTVFYSINAAAAGNQATLIPLVTSKRDSQPAIGDDVWFVPDIFDATPTAALPGGTLPAGVDLTLTPEFGQVTGRPMEILTEVTDGASDRLRKYFVVDVTEGVWFCLLAGAVAGAPVLTATAVGSY